MGLKCLLTHRPGWERQVCRDSAGVRPPGLKEGASPWQLQGGTFPQLSESGVLNTLNFLSVSPAQPSLPASAVSAGTSPDLGLAAARGGRLSYFRFWYQYFTAFPLGSSETTRIPSAPGMRSLPWRCPLPSLGPRGPWTPGLLGSQSGCVTWDNCAGCFPTAA